MPSEIDRYYFLALFDLSDEAHALKLPSQAYNTHHILIITVSSLHCVVMMAVLRSLVRLVHLLSLLFSLLGSSVHEHRQVDRLGFVHKALPKER